MYRLLLGIAAAFVLFASTASASNVSLLCGLTTLIVDLDDKSVIMKEPVLDSATNDQRTKLFKDGRKYEEDRGAIDRGEATQYVRISEQNVDFGQARKGGSYSQDHRIDRRTGVLMHDIGKGENSASKCSLLPTKALF